MSNISMDNIILSTAAFCLWDISIQEKLEYCHTLGFKNVQIALSTRKMLKNFVGHLNDVPQIKKFKDLSIHAPWCGIKYGQNSNTMEILECLRLINDYYPVSRYVFNYDSIFDIDILYNCGLSIMIRNPVRPDSWHKFSSNIQEKNLPCVFDLNRAARSDYPINTMIDEMQESVAEVHVSGFINGKNRMPVVSTKQEHLLKHLNRFNMKETPIIIEGLFSSRDFPGILAEKKLIMRYC